LLTSRKESFLQTKEWEDSDSELCTSSSDSDQEFVVEKIVGKKIVGLQVFYKVKWKYYEGSFEFLLGNSISLLPLRGQLFTFPSFERRDLITL
jgi:hypothetical protein